MMAAKKLDNRIVGIISLLFLAAIFAMQYVFPRTEFYPLLACNSLAFVGYLFFVLSKNISTRQVKFLFGIAIVARLLLLFGIPNLSDDFYRFIWDGLTWQNEIANPFDFKPKEYILMTTVPEHMRALVEQMNSPNYYSVYPSVHQLVFSFATLLFPKSIFGAVFVMKLFLFAAEIIAIVLLVKLCEAVQLDKSKALLYALNPLIIMEFCGNMHFEGVMITFLLLTLYLLHRQKQNWAAGSFALAILTKLHPLMLLPFIAKYLGAKKSITFTSISGLLTLIPILFIFVYPTHSTTDLQGIFFSRISNFSESLELYFQTFEFNASIYYFFRWIGFHIYGYNAIALIGKLLFVMNLIALIIIWLKQKRSFQCLIQSFAIAYFIYSLLATTVHPWYILSILPFALLIRFKTPFVWSAFIFLSYFAYSTTDWHENFYFLFLEYTCIFAFLIFELTSKQQLENKIHTT